LVLKPYARLAAPIVSAAADFQEDTAAERRHRFVQLGFAANNTKCTDRETMLASHVFCSVLSWMMRMGST